MPAPSANSSISSSRLSPGRYIFLVLGAVLALSVLAGINARSEFGRFTKSGYASCAYIESKVALGSRISSPKLVVVAGSNAALGINVRTLTNTLSIRGFNFALVATFAPGFQLFEARKILKSGDAVLLPFEYLAYEYGPPTNGLVDAVYSCGLDYWRSLNWPERLLFVFALRPQRFFSTLQFDRATVESVATSLKDSIDSFGDEPLTASAQAASTQLQVATHQPIVVHFRDSSSGAEGIRAFAIWAKANHVALFATWPNTLYFPQYKLNPAFAEIRNFYRSLGVEVIGEPEDAMFSSQYLADTIYHLTPEGIVLRTAKLTQLLGANRAFMNWASGRATPGPAP
jgi:hypothetical protein